MKAAEIVLLSLKTAKVLGVGQQPLQEDLNDSLRLLNLMLSQWNRKRWLVYHLQDLVVNSTGAEFYTVGPGGNLDFPVRPSKIQRVFVRRNFSGPISGPDVVPLSPTPSPYVFQATEAGSVTVTGGSGVSLFYSDASGPPAWAPAVSPISVLPLDAVQMIYSSAPLATFSPTKPRQTMPPVPASAVDFQLTTILAYEDYSRIALKGIEAFPRYAFYDPAFELGRLYVWPQPAAGAFQIHVLVTAHLESVSSLAQELNLPPEYQAALMYNLAVRLTHDIGGMEPNPTLINLAKDSLDVLRGANAALTTLRMPQQLRRRGPFFVTTGSTS